MFEVGFTEIVLILGLALLVLGPEKLPGLAEKVGRWTGRARSMARQLRTQLEQEVTLDELAKSRPMQPSPPQDTAASSTAGDHHPADDQGTDPHPQEAHPDSEAHSYPEVHEVHEAHSESHPETHPEPHSVPEADVHDPVAGSEPAPAAAAAAATVTTKDLQ